MDGSNLVAVITRTKDRPHLLLRALQSVVSQTHQDYIHVIVNDGGNVDQIREAISASGSKAYVTSIDSQGRMEYASNEGLRFAKSAVNMRPIAFAVIHDDDDSWSPEFLKTMIREFYKYQDLVPSVKGILCRANRIYEKIEGNIITTDHLEPHAPRIPEIGLLRIADLLDDHNNFAPIQFLYRYDALEKVGMYDPTFLVYGDWDFNLRFLQHFDIALTPAYLAFYHWRLSGAGSDANSILGVDRVLQREVYRQRIQNRYLREGNALGTLMNMRTQ